MSILHELEKLRRELRMRIGNLVRRGEISVANAGGFLQFKGYAGDDDGDEQFDEVSLWQHFGFTSRPVVDTEVLAFGLMGRSEEAIAVAEDSYEHKPADLDPGEAVLYASKASGGGQAQVRCQPDGTVALTPGTGKFVEVGGNTDAQVKGTSLQSAVSALGAPTSTPAVVGAVDTLLLQWCMSLYTLLGSHLPLSTKAKVG